MPTFTRNLRFGLRMLVKQPGISAISIMALALGIGLTAMMYSIVHAADRDLPFEGGARIFHLQSTNHGQGIQQMGVLQHDYLDWRAQQTSFEDLAAFYQGTINVSGSERPVRFEGAFMTPSTFALIRTEAALGRVFAESDAEFGAPPALLLGHDLWRNQYQSDPGVVGREVRVNGRPGTIIGVMPEGFSFPFSEEAWLPLQIDMTPTDRGQNLLALDVIGRLPEGTTLDYAVAELDRIAERLEAQYPETNEGRRVFGQRYVRDYIDNDTMMMLWTMQGAVLLVLLIACANVANLLLSRALDRSKEVAIRTALGASRRQIMAQFLTEVMVLSTIGGLLGLVIARIGTGMFEAAIADIQKPFWIVINLDWTVFLVTGAAVLVASLLAGMLPALQVSGSNLNDVLKDEARGSSSFKLGRVSKALVVVEVAFSCGLLVGAGLMIKSVVQLSNVDYGFPTEVFTARVGLFESDYPEVEQRRQFFRELRDRLAAQPGVLAATLTDALPGSQMAGMTRFKIEGESYVNREDHPLANTAVIGAGFLETFDIGVLQGRDFNRLDTVDSLPVVLVNRSHAEKFFPDESPLGQRIRYGTDEESDNPWLTIVGVVPDLYMNGVANAGRRAPDGMYLALEQTDRRFLSIAVRGQGDPLAMAGTVRQQVVGLDPDLPIYWVRTLQDRIDEDTWFYRVFGNLFMVFGFAALFLATIGLYGVMSFSVRRRTSEVGLRMALGARRADVLRLVVKQGLSQIGIGLVLGLGLAALTGGGLQMVLFQVDARDPAIFAGITLVLAITGMVACLLPANRASRIDPVIALRNQ